MAELSPPPVAPLQASVAVQFASRPTPHSVALQLIHDALLASHPDLEAFDSSTLRLFIPEQEHYRHLPLIDVFVEHLVAGTRFDFSAQDNLDYFLSARPPHKLKTAAGAHPDNARIESALNARLATFPISFQQALIEYWCQDSGAGNPRGVWLGEVIRRALMVSLASAQLDAAERAMIAQVIDCPERDSRLSHYGQNCVRAYFLDITVQHQKDAFIELSSELVLSQQRPDSTTILLCKPSGVIESFASQDALDQALGQRLGKHYVVETLKSRRYEPLSDVFQLQAAVVLNRQLEDLGGTTVRTFRNQAAMNYWYALQTDVARLFDKAVQPGQWQPEKLDATLPDWLRGASAADKFAYQGHIVELADAQRESGGQSYLDGISDLHRFAADKLRERMLADHPVDANYDADDLLLNFTVAHGVPGGWGSVEQVSVTLTELAISNLSGKRSGQMSIRHKRNQLIMDWMTPAYIGELVSAVDIGKYYPETLKRYLIDDRSEAAHREQLYARELRVQLPLLALQLKIKAQMGISQLGYRYVAAVMQTDPTRREVDGQDIVIRPLAFKHSPDVERADRVGNMFVIGPRDTRQGPHLLYRPFYTAQILLEYPSLQGLFDAVKDPGALQDSVLSWMDDAARRIYAHGGFDEPHLPRIIFDTNGEAFDPVQPAQLALEVLEDDYGLQLFKANAQALVELADRQSVSNTESRWAVLCQGGWLLFNTVLPVLRGPAAVLGWLVQTVASLKSDLEALHSDDVHTRMSAAVDLLLNVGMSVLHLSLPTVIPAEVAEPPKPGDLLPVFGPRLRPAIEKEPLVLVDVEPEADVLPGQIVGNDTTLLDFSWSNASSKLTVELRKRLETLRVKQPIALPAAEGEGEYQGLYKNVNVWYAILERRLYRVALEPDGVNIVDAENPSRRGPRLQSGGAGQWELDLGLRLRGGGPKKSIKDYQATRDSKYETLSSRYKALRDEAIQQDQIVQDREEALGKAYAKRLEIKKRVSVLKGLAEQDSTQWQPQLLAKQTELVAVLKDEKQQRQRYIQAMESMLEIERTSSQTISEMSKLAKHRINIGVVARLTVSRAENLARIKKELFLTFDWPAVNEAASKLVQEGVSASQRAGLYQDYLDVLKETIDVQEKILETSIEFDNVLQKVAAFDLGALQDRDAITVRLEKERLYDTLDYRVEHLFALGEMSLDRLHIGAAQASDFYSKCLIGGPIRSAGLSHAELQVAEGYLDEQRIQVLESSIEQYELSENIGRYLLSSKFEYIRLPYLERYMAHLAEVRTSAEQDLAALIREAEMPETKPLNPRKPAYLNKKSARKRVIRTRDQRTLVGDERETAQGESGKYVDVLDTFNHKVIASFHEHGGVWSEEVDLAGAVPVVSKKPSLPDARSSANALLGQRDQIIAKVEGFSKTAERPVELEDILNQHAAKFDAAAAALREVSTAAEDQGLITQLVADAQALRFKGQQLRIEAYTRSRSPSGEQLLYLRQHDQVGLVRIGARTAVKGTSDDFLESYHIVDNEGKPLWVAHFHYPTGTIARTEFSKAHLKLYSQRNLGRKAQLQQAKSNQEVIAIYRGDLSKALAAQIFPLLDPL
ncbi:hypothetical protein D9M71_81520 [compost metagenome]